MKKSKEKDGGKNNRVNMEDGILTGGWVVMYFRFKMSLSCPYGDTKCDRVCSG